jgi:hypothetical protein
MRFLECGALRLVIIYSPILLSLQNLEIAKWFENSFTPENCANT